MKAGTTAARTAASVRRIFVPCIDSVHVRSCYNIWPCSRSNCGPAHCWLRHGGQPRCRARPVHRPVSTSFLGRLPCLLVACSRGQPRFEIFHLALGPNEEGRPLVDFVRHNLQHPFGPRRSFTSRLWGSGEGDCGRCVRAHSKAAHVQNASKLSRDLVSIMQARFLSSQTRARESASLHGQLCPACYLFGNHAHGCTFVQQPELSVFVLAVRGVAIDSTCG